MSQSLLSGYSLPGALSRRKKEVWKCVCVCTFWALFLKPIEKTVSTALNIASFSQRSFHLNSLVSKVGNDRPGPAGIIVP